MSLISVEIINRHYNSSWDYVALLFRYNSDNDSAMFTRTNVVFCYMVLKDTSKLFGLASIHGVLNWFFLCFNLSSLSCCLWFYNQNFALFETSLVDIETNMGELVYQIICIPDHFWTNYSSNISRQTLHKKKYRWY